MQNLYIFKTLSIGDYKNIQRDSLINWMVAIPILVAMLARVFLPRVAEWLLTAFNFDLTQYNILINIAFILLTPMMFGVIIGFLLLDERDDDTLTALQVTPLSMGAYLSYRLGVPFMVSIFMSAIIMPITGLPTIPWPGLLLVILLAASFAPMMALFLAAFAENKVVGFALMKAANALLILPLAAYFLPSNRQFLAGLIPTWWPLKLYGAIESGQSFWGIFALGMVYQLLLLVILLKRFEKVIHR